MATFIGVADFTISWVGSVHGHEFVQLIFALLINAVNVEVS